MSDVVQQSRLNEILEDLVALRRATRKADVPVAKQEPDEDIVA